MREMHADHGAFPYTLSPQHLFAGVGAERGTDFVHEWKGIDITTSLLQDSRFQAWRCFYFRYHSFWVLLPTSFISLSGLSREAQKS